MIFQKIMSGKNIYKYLNFSVAPSGMRQMPFMNAGYNGHIQWLPQIIKMNFQITCYNLRKQKRTYNLAKNRTYINLLRTAGRFIDQRHKRQGRVISISIANKEFTLMQI